MRTLRPVTVDPSTEPSISAPSVSSALPPPPAPPGGTKTAKGTAKGTTKGAAKASRSKDATNWVQARQVQRVVTRVDPWSMLRIALSFALCLWLIIVVASIVIWQIAVVTGSIGKIENFLAQLLAEGSFSINGLTMLEGAAVSGLVLFVTGAVMAMIISILFNLVAGVFGGIRFTVVELETARPSTDEA